MTCEVIFEVLDRIERVAFGAVSENRSKNFHLALSMGGGYEFGAQLAIDAKMGSKFTKRQECRCGGCGLVRVCQCGHHLSELGELGKNVVGRYEVECLAHAKRL